MLQTGKMINRDDIEGFMETKEQADFWCTCQRKVHSVAEVDGTYQVTFYRDGIDLGTIAYEGKSIHYVDSAVDNWYYDVLTEETIERYRLER